MVTENNLTPGITFTVRDVPVRGDLILAPMDGYSDLPFRLLARSLGSAMSYTEFLNGIDVVYGHPHLHERVAYAEGERPVVFQVLDDDVERMIRAAHKLRALNPDILDINMGCSARRVSNRGAGSALLRTPEKIAEIFSRLTREMDIPITGKIRLGWDDGSLNYLDVAKTIEDNGGSLIAVHGRTREQAYGGDANWDAIAEVKRHVRVPVIANGDVRSAADIERIKAHTGCDGVMIGRAAVQNPWLFSRVERADVSTELVYQTLKEHLGRMLAFYGDERGLVLFRKYAARYLEPYMTSRDQRGALLTCTSSEYFLYLATEIMRAAPEVETQTAG